jgi:hypothetical protein
MRNIFWMGAGYYAPTYDNFYVPVADAEDAARRNLGTCIYFSTRP